MILLKAVVNYGNDFRDAGGSSRQIVRAWMETGVTAADAARLEQKGYTPQTAAARIAVAPERFQDERDAEAAIDAMIYGPDVVHRVATLTHGEPEFTALVDGIRADPELVAAVWDDAEGSPDELDLAGTRVSVVLVDGALAAWCAAREILEDGVPVLKCLGSYEVRAYRGQGFYAAAYGERHRRVVEPCHLPGLTYLFENPDDPLYPAVQPIALHEAHGWRQTGSHGRGELDGHYWRELRRPAD